MTLPSYSHIRALGHAEIRDLFTAACLIEEKVDGSQFSFGQIEGELRARSSGTEQRLDAPDKMFARAVETVRELGPSLHPGWIYRGEYLDKPKHNVLAYSRVPAKHIMIFDIEAGTSTLTYPGTGFLSYPEKRDEAARLGLECVPLLATSGPTQPATADFLRGLLEKESVLGGPKIEGVVVKPAAYNLWGRDGKVLMGKFVSEAFKEKHQKDWKISNPGGKDVVALLIAELRTEARWQKAVQHLAEDGKLRFAPEDIGQLLIELERDTGTEEKEYICGKLWKWAWPQIARGVKAGFAEYYKEKLLEAQFEKKEEEQ